MHSKPLMRLVRLLALIVPLVALAGCFGDGSGKERIPGTPQVAEADGDVGGFVLVFADEFDEGSTPSPDNWTIETGYGPNNDGWGNNEWQLYTDSPDNVRVEDGNLVLSALCPTPPCDVRDGTVTSGKINSLNKFNFRYGKVEARIKPPVGEGAWPAFWSLGANHPDIGWPRSGEIDFMEMHNAFSDDKTTHFTMHWCDETLQAPEQCSFPEGWIFFTQNLSFEESLGDDFHIFEAEWDAERIVGKIDGITYFTKTIDPGTMEEFQREFYMILNVAMGGTLGSDNRPPSGNETFPQTMLVDYVRVYQREGDQSGSSGGTTLIDFEDDGGPYTFADFEGGVQFVTDNPDMSGINTSAKVGQHLKFNGAVFAGSTLVQPLEVVAGSTVTMKVWSPRPVNVLFKLEGEAPAESEVPHGGTGWEQLTFNLPAASGSFTGITLIFDLGTVGDAEGDPDNWTFYFDDIEIVPPSGGGGGGEAPSSFDFEDSGGPYVFADFEGGAAFVADNPDMSGINTSAKVVQMLKFDGAVFAGSTLVTPLEVVSGSSFTMKVWSQRPVMVLFKLEGDAPAEVEVPHGGTGWEELTFDLSSANGSFTGITVIFDLGTAGDAENDPDNWTFYFDDIQLIPPDMGDPGPDLLQIDLPITFDDPAVDYTVTDFGDPVSAMTTLVPDPDDAANMVASTTKPLGAPVWAGVTMSTTAGFASPIPFTATATTIGMRVYSPDAGIPVRLKAEDMVGGTIGVETEVLTTVANEWETLVFDFASPVAETPALDLDTSYTALSVFFNFGTDGDMAGEQTYLWDDVEFGVLAPIVDETPPTLTEVGIASSNADPTLATTGDVITVTLTADEAIMTPVVTIGGTTENVTVSGAVATWEATRALTEADADGAVTFSIEYADLAGNDGAPVSATTDSSGVTLDATAPTVAIEGAPADFISVDPIPVTIQFSEPVTGFDQGDVQLTNGSLAPEDFVEVDGDTYTANVKPDGTLNDLVIAVAAGAAADAAGNVSLAADDVSITNLLDPEIPRLDPISIASSNANDGYARTGDVVTISMTASEEIETPVVTIAGTSDGVTVTAGEGTSWTAERTALATDMEGPIAFEINIVDLAGNAGFPATGTTDDSSVIFDITAPMLTITGVPDPIEIVEPILVTFEFDEDVVDFTVDDVQVTNGTADAFVTVDDATYTAEIMPDGMGDLTVLVATDAAMDLAGNGSAEQSLTATLDLQPIWDMVWFDEFDGTELGEDWTARTTDLDCPDPCDGVQSYHPDQVEVGAGLLTITAAELARQNGALFTSGLIDTRGKQEFKYGRIEIDARMPGTVGTLPSLWMLPASDAVYGPWPQSGEIDIVNAPELGSGGGTTLEHTLRYGLPEDQDTTTTATSDAPAMADMELSTYAIEWEADEIRWFVDGAHVATQIQENWYAYSEDADGVYTLGEGAAPFDQEFYLVLSLALGDNAGGGLYPQTLQVEAVRVYECANAVDPDAGTGCANLIDAVDPLVDPVVASGAPYTPETLGVYTNEPATLPFLDSEGTPTDSMLVPDTFESSAVVTSTIDALDGANTVWNVNIAAAMTGTGRVLMRPGDFESATGYFDLTGGGTAGEVLFRMRVNSITDDPALALSVGLDSDTGSGRHLLEGVVDDGVWRNYSVKIADIVNDSFLRGGSLNLSRLVSLFELEATGGTVDLDLDEIEVKVACRDEGGCEATARLEAVVADVVYEQNFDELDKTDIFALTGDGWLVFGNVYDSLGEFQFGYGPFGAPNDGANFSAIVDDQGGPGQGTQQLTAFSDYGCCQPSNGHFNGTDLVESNLFQEQPIGPEDIGKTWLFSFEVKKGLLAGSSTAFAFIKTLDPAAGFATTNFVTAETTGTGTEWTGDSISLSLEDPLLEGQLIQFGFITNASNFEPSSMVYDNIKVTATGP